MTPALPPPLASSGKVPILHGVLAASFHLEALQPGDEAAMAQANALVLDWFGSELEWTTNSRIGLDEAFEPTDLSFASAYPTSLALAPHGEAADEEGFLQLLEVNVRRRADMVLVCRGGAPKACAAPWSYELSAEIVAADDTPQLVTPAVLRLTVPASWPLDDFERRVLAIAAVLRLRWGAAGLSYSPWPSRYYPEVDRALYAHARRHPGYDVGLHAAWVEELYNQVRSVSWLTLIGPDLAAQLEALHGRPLQSETLVQVSSAGGATVLRAGAQPEAGDRNRRALPLAYVRADEMIRPIRAAEGLDFCDSWSESTTSEWLRRFERRLA